MNAIHAASILWVAWYASWLAASVWRDRPVKRLGLPREAVSRALTVLGVFLLFFSDLRGGSRLLLWEPSPVIARLLLVPVGLGFLFAWWARIHLGRLWSPDVTRKPDHRIVDTGPYAFVRHPIYSGLILSAVSTALIRGAVSALVGAMLFALSFYLKARLEEGFLRRELGRAYDDYARHVGMIVPGVG